MPRKKSPVPLDVKVQNLLGQRAEIEKLKKKYTDDYQSTTQTIIGLLHRAKKKTISLSDGQSITVVRPEKVIVDYAAIEEHVDPKVWEKCFTKQFDEDRFAALVLRKEIDPALVAEHSSIKEIAPSIRVTQGER